jgi:hypothetical protein
LALMTYAVLLGSTMYRRWRSGRWQNINIWSRDRASGGS